MKFPPALLCTRACLAHLSRSTRILTALCVSQLILTPRFQPMIRSWRSRCAGTWIRCRFNPTQQCPTRYGSWLSHCLRPAPARSTGWHSIWAGIAGSVHRHLAHRGDTYLSIVDAVRVEMVLRYLESRDRPLSEVATLLGFSSLSAFSRWFSGRFGCSVSTWRRKSAPRIAGADNVAP